MQRESDYWVDQSDTASSALAVVPQGDNTCSNYLSLLLRNRSPNDLLHLKGMFSFAPNEKKRIPEEIGWVESWGQYRFLLWLWIWGVCVLVLIHVSGTVWFDSNDVNDKNAVTCVS